MTPQGATIVLMKTYFLKPIITSQTLTPGSVSDKPAVVRPQARCPRPLPAALPLAGWQSPGTFTHSHCHPSRAAPARDHPPAQVPQTSGPSTGQSRPRPSGRILPQQAAASLVGRAPLEKTFPVHRSVAFGGAGKTARADCGAGNTAGRLGNPTPGARPGPAHAQRSGGHHPGHAGR